MRTCPSCQFLIDDDAQICANCRRPVAAPPVAAMAHAAAGAVDHPSADPVSTAAPSADPTAAGPADPAPPSRRPLAVALVVLVVGAVATAGWMLRDSNDDGLGEFDPDGLDWQTHQDAAGRFVVDLPGPAEITPATRDDVETVVVTGPVWTAVAAREIGPRDVMVGLDTFTAGLDEQLQQLFGVEDVVLLDGREEPYLDGEAMVAEFEGVIDGTAVVGVVEARAQAPLVSVVTTVGIRPEWSDVERVHDRVVGGFRSTL